MRVLHVIDSGGLYGAEMVLLSLAAEQQKLGIAPVIASIGEPHLQEKPLEREAVRRGLRVEKFRMAAGPNTAGARNILELARREKCHLLHSHGYKGNILFGFMPRSWRKIPMIATIHGWTNTGILNRMLLYEWLDGLALRRLDAVVLVSERMKEHRRLRKVDPRKLCVIPNGIDSGAAEKGKETDRDVIDFARQSYTIGAIGRLSPEKGFVFLLEAFQKFAGQENAAQLVIIGEGSERARLEGLIRGFGLTEKVLLTGFRPQARQYLPLFNLFVLPSLTEGLPITLLEALQAGVPVLATRVGGIPEVLRQGKAGQLVPPGDAQALTVALTDIYRNQTRVREKTEYGRSLIRKYYTSEAMARQYLKRYEQVLGGAIPFCRGAEQEAVRPAGTENSCPR